MSAFYGCLYPHADTEFRHQMSCTVNEKVGRAIVRIEVDDLAIQANCWEHMQRLVDALTAEIARAKQAEQDAALVEFDYSDVAVAS